MKDKASGVSRENMGAERERNMHGLENVLCSKVLTQQGVTQSAWLWHIILILYIMFIYSNSMRPAVQSSAESGSVLRLLQNLAESVGIAVPWLTEHIVRKCAHFIEYTGLGILLRQSASYIKWNKSVPESMETLTALEERTLGWRKKEIRSFIFLELHRIAIFAIPFVDETIQLFTEGRSGQISDVWLDMAGVLTGTLLYLVVSRIYVAVGRKY